MGSRFRRTFGTRFSGRVTWHRRTEAAGRAVVDAVWVVVRRGVVPVRVLAVTVRAAVPVAVARAGAGVASADATAAVGRAVTAGATAKRAVAVLATRSSPS